MLRIIRILLCCTKNHFNLFLLVLVTLVFEICLNLTFDINERHTPSIAPYFALIIFFFFFILLALFSNQILENLCKVVVVVVKFKTKVFFCFYVTSIFNFSKSDFVQNCSQKRLIIETWNLLRLCIGQFTLIKSCNPSLQVKTRSLLFRKKILFFPN